MKYLLEYLDTRGPIIKAENIDFIINSIINSTINFITNLTIKSRNDRYNPSINSSKIENRLLAIFITAIDLEVYTYLYLEYNIEYYKALIA